jgi:hypothetical protein
VWSFEGQAKGLYPNSGAFLLSDEGVFVRGCYPTLLKQTTERLEWDRARVVIRGTPGIGKSMFEHLLLLQWAHDDRVELVLLHIQLSDTRVAFPKTGAVRLVDEAAFKRMAQGQGTRVVVDCRGQMVHSYECATVVVTSPDRSVYRAFLKDDGSSLTMGTWSPNEMEALLDSTLFLGGDEDKALVKRRIGFCGNIPRYAFASRCRDIQSEMDEAVTLMASRRVEDIINAVNTMESSVETEAFVHRVIHHNAEGAGFFASEYVARKMCEVMLKNGRNRVRQLLQSTLVFPSCRAMFTRSFENRGHCIIMTGKTRPLIRCLEGGSPSDSEVLELPPRRLAMLDVSRKEMRDSDLSHPEESAEWDCTKEYPPTLLYLLPSSANFGAVDSFTEGGAGMPGAMFQFTVSPNHSLTMKKVEEALSVMDSVDPSGRSGKRRLYFCVPNDIYATFSKQSFLTKKGTTAKRLPAAIRNRVEQWALCVELAPNFLPSLEKDPHCGRGAVPRVCVSPSSRQLAGSMSRTPSQALQGDDE